VCSQPQTSMCAEALVAAFEALSDELSQGAETGTALGKQAQRSGCTAVVAVIASCDGGGRGRRSWGLTVANCGDCRAVLCHRHHDASSSAARLSALRLSVDHKPDTEAEHERITSVSAFSLTILLPRSLAPSLPRSLASSLHASLPPLLTCSVHAGWGLRHRESWRRTGRRLPCDLASLR
jgi:serine/threonine protein phosphatase PrpC